MTRKILVPIDGSELAQKALKYAIETHPDAEVTVLYAINLEPLPGEGAVITFEEQMLEGAYGYAERIFDRAQQVAEEADYEGELETETVEGKPSREIVNFAEDFDAVVMGSHGRDGTTRILLGSVAETVARRAPVPVTIVR